MFDEYERYQGLVLREIVIHTIKGVHIAPFQRSGRQRAFILNDQVAIFVKHSSKRLSPWQFTFHHEQLADLFELEAACDKLFLIFVCGPDGLATITMKEFRQIATFMDTEQAGIRIERKPRSMYGLSGNRGELQNKVQRGISIVGSALRKRRG
jgi:hypothetical protein